METAQKQIEELASNYAAAKILRQDFNIQKRYLESTKITVDIVNKFLVTRLKYPDHSRIDILLQLSHDYPETTTIVYNTMDSSGYGLPISERENVKVYSGNHIDKPALGRKFTSDRLVDITRLSTVDVTVADRLRWHVLSGNLGKLVNSKLKSRYLVYIKNKGSR